MAEECHRVMCGLQGRKVPLPPGTVLDLVLYSSSIILQEASEPLEAPWYLLTMIQFLKMLHLRVFLKPLVGQEFSQVTESSSGQGHIFCISSSTESSMTVWINAALVQGQTNKCSAEDLRQ